MAGRTHGHPIFWWRGRVVRYLGAGRELAQGPGTPHRHILSLSSTTSTRLISPEPSVDEMTASWTRLALPPFSMCCKVSSEVNRARSRMVGRPSVTAPPSWYFVCDAGSSLGQFGSIYIIQCCTRFSIRFCARDNAIARPCLSVGHCNSCPTLPEAAAISGSRTAPLEAVNNRSRRRRPNVTWQQPVGVFPLMRPPSQLAAGTA